MVMGVLSIPCGMPHRRIGIASVKEAIGARRRALYSLTGKNALVTSSTVRSGAAISISLRLLQSP